MFDLKSFRLDYKLTQIELAKLLECGQSNISMMEKSKSITDEQYSILAKNYGTDNISKYQKEYQSEADIPSMVNEKMEQYNKTHGVELNNILKLIEEKEKRIQALERLITYLESENEHCNVNYFLCLKAISKINHFFQKKSPVVSRAF